MEAVDGNAIGGIKVIARDGWFAARPSGTEDVYKIYAESFKGPDHLKLIQQQAQEMIAKIQQQESWLTTYALPGKVAVEMVAEHSYAQWTGVFSALTVIASCAKDAAESKRCAAQLAEQDSIMNRALGVKTA